MSRILVSAATLALLGATAQAAPVSYSYDFTAEVVSLDAGEDYRGPGVGTTGQGSATLTFDDSVLSADGGFVADGFTCIVLGKPCYNGGPDSYAVDMFDAATGEVELRLISQSWAEAFRISGETGLYSETTAMDTPDISDYSIDYALTGVTLTRSEPDAEGPSPDVTPVPLPASGVLLLGALGAAAAGARRRR